MEDSLKALDSPTSRRIPRLIRAQRSRTLKIKDWAIAAATLKDCRCHKVEIKEKVLACRADYEKGNPDKLIEIKPKDHWV